MTPLFQSIAQLLKPYVIKNGYHAVALRLDGKTVRATVHGIVADTFIGRRPANADVCHFDGNKTNNSAANLRYATRAENIADKKRHGTDQAGERNPAAKLTNAQATTIKARRQAGERLAVLAAEYGVAASCVSRIASGTRRAAQ
jgi:hypothetical protein